MGTQCHDNAIALDWEGLLQVWGVETLRLLGCGLLKYESNCDPCEPFASILSNLSKKPSAGIVRVELAKTPIGLN
jgi:hypothetical protein